MRSSDLERGQRTTEIQASYAPLGGGGRDQNRCDTQDATVPAVAHPLDGDHSALGTRAKHVAVEQEQAPAVVGHGAPDAQITPADHAGALLYVLAGALDDIERTRVANENRLRDLAQVKGLDDTDEAVVTLTALVDGLKALEAQSVKALEKAMRTHPLGPWVRRTSGLGLKQTARLLAAIGDPTWNALHERPRRGPAELWQFAGHGDPARSRRRKGQKVEYSPEVKKRTYLVALSCMKTRTSPYRPVYDRARASWADRDVSDGHAHNHALRLVGKAVLKDLFIEARALDHGPIETHLQNVEG